MIEVVVAQSYAGVREVLAGWLESAADITVVASAGTVADAARASGHVIVSGATFPDGDVTDLIALPRPVVAAIWQPLDELPDLAGAAAVVRAGSLQRDLPAAVRAARGTERGLCQ